MISVLFDVLLIVAVFGIIYRNTALEFLRWLNKLIYATQFNIDSVVCEKLVEEFGGDATKYPVNITSSRFGNTFVFKCSYDYDDASYYIMSEDLNELIRFIITIIRNQPNLNDTLGYIHSRDIAIIPDISINNDNKYDFLNWRTHEYKNKDSYVNWLIKSYGITNKITRIYIDYYMYYLFNNGYYKM